jgi:ribosomal protein S18 acetylase RimI-like enzyme
MKITIKEYDDSVDFIRVRDFLVETFSLYQRPFNWCIDRWNFCRYFVVPLHTHYNVQYFGVPTQVTQPYRDELICWQKNNRIWENEYGNIVGVVTSENEEPGEAWIQIHPDYVFLYDEMVTYIEENLADRVDGIVYVKLYIDEDSELKQIAEARGYRKLVKQGSTHLEYNITDPKPPQLQEGFVIRSVMDEDDPDKRRISKSIAFGANYCPSNWAPASVYKVMQQSPDYRRDLDLFIVGPDGDYISFCTIWLDEKNRYGNFEPVGTHHEYQRMGFGTALMTEGFRRMAKYGITRSFMDVGNPFYRKVGFRETPYSYYPWIKYFRA